MMSDERPIVGITGSKVLSVQLFSCSFGPHVSDCIFEKYFHCCNVTCVFWKTKESARCFVQRLELSSQLQTDIMDLENHMSESVNKSISMLASNYRL